MGGRRRRHKTDPPVVEAQQRIVEACKRHGVAAGIHNGTAAYGLKMIAAGYQFVPLASESRFMAAKAAEEVAAVRKTGVKAGQLPAYEMPLDAAAIQGFLATREVVVLATVQ